MESAIVSGITGHLGQEVVRQLLRAGVKTVGLTRRRDARLNAAGVDWRRFDGRTESLLGIFERVRPDTVMHLAGLSRREHVSGDVNPFVEANVQLGVQLLEAMRISGCRHLITAGSYLQHGDDGSSRPYNLYAATKLAFESVAAYYAEAYGISVVRLTLSDIYSEHDTCPKLMTELANAWATRTVATVRDAQTRTDLIHVEDAAAAFLQAAAMLEQGGCVGALSRFSVSSGVDIGALELARLFERIGGRPLPVSIASAVTSQAMKPWRGAPLPGWMPRVTLEQGVGRIISARH